jgi:hypothetical protein
MADNLHYWDRESLNFLAQVHNRLWDRVYPRLQDVRMILVWTPEQAATGFEQNVKEGTGEKVEHRQAQLCQRFCVSAKPCGTIAGAREQEGKGRVRGTDGQIAALRTLMTNSMMRALPSGVDCPWLGPVESDIPPHGMSVLQFALHSGYVSPETATQSGDRYSKQLCRLLPGIAGIAQGQDGAVSFRRQANDLLKFQVGVVAKLCAGLWQLFLR